MTAWAYAVATGTPTHEHKLSRLRDSHMLSLIDDRDDLIQRTQRGIPFFDPEDGGDQAELLLLLSHVDGDPCSIKNGLNTLNAVLDQGRERVQVTRDAGTFARGTRLEVLGPLDPSVRVARSAAELLHRLDESRNNSRRWCSMQGCGNVHKQARFRQAARQRKLFGAGSG